jgi:hypothetical protein
MGRRREGEKGPPPLQLQISTPLATVRAAPAVRSAGVMPMRARATAGAAGAVARATNLRRRPLPRTCTPPSLALTSPLTASCTSAASCPIRTGPFTSRRTSSSPASTSCTAGGLGRFTTTSSFWWRCAPSSLTSCRCLFHFPAFPRTHHGHHNLAERVQTLAHETVHLCTALAQPHPLLPHP